MGRTFHNHRLLAIVLFICGSFLGLAPLSASRQTWTDEYMVLSTTNGYKTSGSGRMKYRLGYDDSQSRCQ